MAALSLGLPVAARGSAAPRGSRQLAPGPLPPLLLPDSEPGVGCAAALLLQEVTEVTKKKVGRAGGWMAGWAHRGRVKVLGFRV